MNKYSSNDISFQSLKIRLNGKNGVKEIQKILEVNGYTLKKGLTEKSLYDDWRPDSDMMRDKVLKSERNIRKSNESFFGFKNIFAKLFNKKICTISRNLCEPQVFLTSKPDNEEEIKELLKKVGYELIDALVDYRNMFKGIIPDSKRSKIPGPEGWIVTSENEVKLMDRGS